MNNRRAKLIRVLQTLLLCAVALLLCLAFFAGTTAVIGVAAELVALVTGLPVGIAVFVVVFLLTRLASSGESNEAIS